MSMPILTIDRLEARTTGEISRPILRGVSMSVAEGEVHGLVGLSGAGKSMIAKAVLGVLPASIRIDGGSIHFRTTELVGLRPERHRALTAREIALIPQDPLSALNPSRRIAAQMTDVMRLRMGLSRQASRAKALALLEEVQIRDPETVLRRYPHELSGGMRQRVLIATAFASEPKLIVADEPTTALDVTVQKQILKLIHDLRQRHGTAILFVTHDLGVVAKICDRISVMHAGTIVEHGTTAAVFARPRHAFTRALLAATPRHDRPSAELRPVPPDVLEATVEPMREAAE
ncbi:MAG: ABC transporter ATP-binding protein [Hyphomicrobiaceae bacterium]